MFSIRKPTEAIVIDILMNGRMEEGALLQKTNEKTKELVDGITQYGRHLAYLLLAHTPQTFAAMLRDMEAREVVKRTEILIKDEPEWEPPKQFVKERLYELVGKTREEFAPTLRLAAVA